MITHRCLLSSDSPHEPVIASWRAVRLGDAAETETLVEEIEAGAEEA